MSSSRSYPFKYIDKMAGHRVFPQNLEEKHAYDEWLLNGSGWGKLLIKVQNFRQYISVPKIKGLSKVWNNKSFL